MLIVKIVIKVRKGIIVRFWKSRMVKFDCLIWVVILFCLDSNCRVKVVEDRVNLNFVIRVVISERFVKRVRSVSVILDIRIWVVLRLKIECCIIYNCVGFNFNLIMNNNIIMFNLVICINCLFFWWMRLRFEGLISVFVVR